MKTSTLLRRQKILLPLLLFFFLFNFSAGYAQTGKSKEKILQETNIKELTKLEKELRKKAEQEKEKAIEMAKEKGWIIRKEFEDGRVMELMKVREDGKPLYYITHNKDAAATISTDHVYPGASAGLDLDGTGMIVGEWDGGGVLTTHQEFNNTGSTRVTQKDNATATSNHSTHVGGTMIGGGVVTDAKGMAFNANLDAYDWNADESEMAAAASDGLILSNHSYGFSAGWNWTGTEWEWVGDESISSEEDYRFGFYGQYCVNYDNIARNAPYYLIVKSAGNDRGDGPANADPPVDGGENGFDCIGYWGNAKNILTVGAVEDLVEGYTGSAGDVSVTSFSSFGPSDDGRIKPDIVGNGAGLYSTSHSGDDSYTSMSGTSMSAPNVTGSMLLLQEHANETMGDFMKSATLKALVIHTADEAGEHEGPDYAYGWGLMNTQKAAEVITNNNLSSFILEENLADGNQWTYDVQATGNDPLIVTVVWTDPAGTPVSAQLDPRTPMLVNDLDVTVTQGANTYYPYKLDVENPGNAATKGENNVDNVEKVYIASPSSGTHTITVSHDGDLLDGAQNFSVIISGVANVSNDMSAIETYPDWTFSEDAIYPKMLIKNMGLNSQGTFDAVLAITDTLINDTIYKSTYNYSGDALTSGKDTILTMPDAWNNPPANQYNVTAWVSLSGDENPANDTTYNKILIAEATPYDHTVGYGWSAYSESGNVNGLYKINLDGDGMTKIKENSTEFMTGMDFTADTMLMAAQYNTNKIYFINASGEAYNLYSLSNVESVTGYTYNANDEKTYVSDYIDSEGVSKLYSVGENGATTLLGTIAEDLIIGLASDYAGNMYAISLGDWLYSVDPTTGAGTKIDSFNVNLNYAQDIGFDRNTGTLFGALYINEVGGGLYKIDTETAELTLVNNFGDEVTGFAVPWTPGPHVVKTWPADSTETIDTVSTVWAKFDVTPTAVDLSGVSISGATNVNASLSGDTLKITHDPFVPGQSYDVTIPAGAVQDSKGSNQEVKWHFSVVPGYTADFEITNANTGNPIDSALININGESLLTDNSGAASIELSNGTYPYVVSKDGFVNSSDDLIISGKDTLVEIALDSLFNISFSVTDAISSDPIDKATIDVDGTKVRTNSSGIATMELINGTYDYTTTKSFYLDTNGTFNVADADKTVDISMTPYADVTFNITDGTNPVEGATLEFNSSVFTTDATGQIIETVAPGTYEYKVEADGFVSDSGSIEVTTDMTKDIVLTPIYNITFNVSDTSGTALGANLTIDGSDYVLTDGQITLQLTPGEYNYTLTLDEYDDYTGTVSVSDNATVNVTMTKTPVGIFDLAERKIQVYPNPTAGLIHVTGENLIGAKIKIRTVSGKTIQTMEITRETTELDLRNLPNGVYIIKVQKGKQAYDEKVILEK